MADETFAAFVERERARLHGEREAIATQQRELETKLAEINRELSAIDAYEAAKSGNPGASPPRSRNASTRPVGRRGSKRDGILELVRQNPAGLTRGEILEKMGLKGDKSGEMSVSNALTALTKGNQVVRDGGKYRGA